MQKRYVVAVRPDGSEGRYRTYPEMMPPLAVDCDRALGAIHLLGTFNPRYLWTIRFFRALAVLELVADAYTVRWLPLATVICAGLAYAIHRALPWAAADFARETVRRHPEVRTRFVLAGIILVDMPRVAPTTPAEWAVSAWGSARAPHDERLDCTLPTRARSAVRRRVLGASSSDPDSPPAFVVPTGRRSPRR